MGEIEEEQGSDEDDEFGHLNRKHKHEEINFSKKKKHKQPDSLQETFGTDALLSEVNKTGPKSPAKTSPKKKGKKKKKYDDYDSEEEKKSLDDSNQLMAFDNTPEEKKEQTRGKFTRDKDKIKAAKNEMNASMHSHRSRYSYISSNT